MSDLHLDTFPPGKKPSIEIHPQAEAVVVAGDLVEDDLSELDGVFDYVKVPVIIVPGNHEYVKGRVNDVVPNLKKYFEDTNVHVLNRDTFVLGNVLFVGATMWTPLDTERCKLDPGWVNEYISFHCCEGMTSTWWSEEFIKDISFIQSALDGKLACQKSVVITHFMPLTKCTPERFIGNPANAFYASDNAKDIMQSPLAPNLWIHGHTHDSVNIEEGLTKIICNPQGGYLPWGVQNENFNHKFLIEI